jgi:hypothetical protein
MPWLEALYDGVGVGAVPASYHDLLALMESLAGILPVVFVSRRLAL